MAMNSPENNIQLEGKEQGEQIQRFVYRILPYWPLVVLALVGGIVGANIYLRYQVAVYSASARLVVNDDTQQKTANLQEIFKIENKNVSSETEKEIQVISSTELLKKVASKMQLNVLYIGKGRLKSSEYYEEDLPFKLQLQDPDSINTYISGDAQIKGNQISFNEVLYPLDTFVMSNFGKIKWTINKGYANTSNLDKVTITVMPVASAAGKLKGSLGISPISKGSSILDITLTDVIPERAVDVLTNLINLYGISTVDYKTFIYKKTQQFLDDRLQLVSDDLSGEEKKLMDFKSKEGVVDLSREGEFYLGKLRGTDAKIAELDVQLDVLKQTEQYLQDRNNSKNPVPASLGLTDPELTGLLNQLYQTEFELEKIRQTSGSKNPQIAVLEEQINKLKPSTQASINNLKNNLLTNRQHLLADNTEVNASLSKIPLKEKMLIDISRQQSIKNAIYTFLLQKREESAIAAASIVNNYRVLEKPVAGGLVYPVSKRNYAIGILAALFCSILFIFLKEFTSNKILFRSQLENNLPMPVLAELNYHQHAKDSPVVVNEGKRSLIAEQFRELRTNLSYVTANAKDKCKVILITSSIPGEGKSFVAINTAISLSLTGDRVVLLECDLRKPKISKELGIDTTIGISNYLIGKVNEDEIIKQFRASKSLSVIPSGPTPPNPAELLKNTKFEELITYLKQHFDFIIIDTPPVAAVTDAKIIGAFADATLFITRHNYTNLALLNLINDIGQKGTLPNINLVLNGIVNKKILGQSYGNSYNYGYGYGYGYGYTDDSKKGRFSFKKIISKLTRKRK